MERDLIQDNPRFKKPALAVLALFEGDRPRRRDEVEAAASEGWDDTQHMSPSVTIDMLVRNHLLAEQVLVDGEVYDGTLDDIQTDERIPDDAEVWSCLVATEQGRRLCEEHKPANALHALFEERPQYADVFSAALWACANEGGCSRADLEAQIGAMPQLQSDPETGRRRVYPQYFIDELESVGAIAWDGAWRVTEAGRAAVGQC